MRGRAFFVIILAVFLISVPTASAEPNLMGWWEFDEGTGTTAGDSSGNGNNGIIWGGATWTTGQIGGALDFDGDGDYVKVDEHYTINITGAITVSIWLKLDGDVSTQRLIGNADSSYYGGYRLGFNDGTELSDGTCRIVFQKANGIPGTGSGNYGTDTDCDRVVSETNAWVTGVWYHIAATWDGTTDPNSMKMYINGVPDASHTAGQGTIGITGLGLFMSSSYYGLDGKIDDVRIYNRALSAGEVEEIYNGGGQVPLYLDFDDEAEVVTEAGFTSFLISDSGTTINGITINISGTLQDRRRGDPTGVPYEDIYRDFIFDYGSPTIMLSGMGAGRECEITIYAFDTGSGGFRSAEWTANGAYLFTTEFDGHGPWPDDINDYAFTGTGYADEYGNLVLTCDQISGSPYAFVNALIMEPQGEYVPVKYAHEPQPLDGEEDVPVDVVLSWEAGATATAHDVYLGTDFDDVNDANRGNPLGVLVSEGQVGTSYDPAGYIKLGTTYYWRADEVNEPNIWKGVVWSFATRPSFVIEDFDSYEDNTALRYVWETVSGSTPAISLGTAIVRDGNSMKYVYDNNLPPYYSEADANIADLGVEDSDWQGMDVNALVLYFRGDANNPIDEQMYVSLTDGDASPHTGTVYYPSMVDVAIPQWQKWNIPISQFVDANDVNLANVARVAIGFGDGGGSGGGTVYFEDITLDTEAEQSTTASGAVSWGTV